MILPFLNLFLLTLFHHVAADDAVNVPNAPSDGHIVYNDFFGISMELSFINEYIGDDASSGPAQAVQYLLDLRNRMDKPLRIRIGGNSVDTSMYYQNQTAMMQLQNEPATDGRSRDNQPVNYGPLLWSVLDQWGKKSGGLNYLLGLPFMDPNNGQAIQIAQDADKVLGDAIDGWLLGNEPDLYGGNGHRQQGYAINDYVPDFGTAITNLKAAPGDLVAKRTLGGPTVCCNWQLSDLFNSGYLGNYSQDLKYITLQRYPRNNCFGGGGVNVPYYMQHSNVVDLGSWQTDGRKTLESTPGSPQLIMTEFNSISCGGIANISDTFAVGSMWTADYALQLASLGFDAAYVHTRERGITYDLFYAADGSAGSPWTTGSPYYSTLVVAEALQSPNGVYVTDLNIANSKSDPNAKMAGYAVYDAKDKTPISLVLFNYDTTTPQKFGLPASIFASMKTDTVLVKYLTSTGAYEKFNIAYGGKTYAGVTDAKARDTNPSSEAWATPNANPSCKANGCTIEIPAPAAAVIFLNGAPFEDGAQTLTNTGSTGGSNGNLNGTSKNGSTTPAPGSAAGIRTSGVVVFVSALAWFLTL